MTPEEIREAKSQWFTPAPIRDAVHQVWGSEFVDYATTKENPMGADLAVFDLQDYLEDTLTHNDTVFLNPPYSQPHWFMRMALEYGGMEQLHVYKIGVLSNKKTTKILQHFPPRLVMPWRGRLEFDMGPELSRYRRGSGIPQKGGNNFDVVLIYWGALYCDEFREAFDGKVSDFYTPYT